MQPIPTNINPYGYKNHQYHYKCMEKDCQKSQLFIFISRKLLYRSECPSALIPTHQNTPKMEHFLTTKTDLYRIATCIIFLLVLFTGKSILFTFYFKHGWKKNLFT